MKTSKRPRELAKNASGLHKHVGTLLTEIEAFKGFEIRQEYPVKKVNPKFKSGREKFDWVILGARIIIECHGKQHYDPIRFGGVDADQAKRNLIATQGRDEKKREAAYQAGWTYVVVKYDEASITAEKLADRIREELACTVVQKSLESYTDIVRTNIAKTKTQKQKVKTKWPSRKIPSRPFPKKR